MSTLEIKNIHAQVVPQEEGEEPKKILHGVNLTINSGAVSYTHLTLPTILRV